MFENISDVAEGDWEIGGLCYWAAIEAGDFRCSEDVPGRKYKRKQNECIWATSKLLHKERADESKR